MVIERHIRQSFLGPHTQERIATCVVGVVGLGGGGSHIAQQLAHIGFKRYVLYEPDFVEDSNLNRLPGGTTQDAQLKVSKLSVSCRTIYSLSPDAEIEDIASRWQERPEPLRKCHIVLGCVDSYQGRQELEVMMRRYLINYIDIGMDVNGEDPAHISGQVILSTPGSPCLRCLGFLTNDNLRREARKYGNAGSQPQVIWANGVLASTAIGIAVDLISDWTRKKSQYRYLVYDGNNGTMKPSITLRNRKGFLCPHFPLEEVGTPSLMSL